MGRRLRRFAGEVTRYLAVSGVATLVAIVLFNVVVHGVPAWFAGPLHAHPLSSYLLANSVGMVVSYYGTRSYAFRHREATGPAGGAVNYVVINLVSFVIPISCLWVSRNVLGYDDAVADNIAGNVVGAALGMVFRFWMFRTFVFTAHRAAGEEHHLPQVEVHHLAAGHELAADLTEPTVADAPDLLVEELGDLEDSASPEVGPGESELVEHEPQEWQAQSHHVVRVAGDA